MGALAAGMVLATISLKKAVVTQTVSLRNVAENAGLSADKRVLSPPACERVREGRVRISLSRCNFRVPGIIFRADTARPEPQPNASAPEEPNVYRYGTSPKDKSSSGAQCCNRGFTSATFRSSGAAKILWSPLTINISSLWDWWLWLETLPGKQETSDWLHTET